MATLRQRLHRKNGSGTYDVIHYETDSQSVIMQDGSNLETKMSNHTHDNRYFTESEMTTKLNAKANKSHTHKMADITDYSTTIPAVSNIWPFPITWTTRTLTYNSGTNLNPYGEEYDFGIKFADYDIIALDIQSISGTASYTGSSGFESCTIMLYDGQSSDENTLWMYNFAVYKNSTETLSLENSFKPKISMISTLWNNTSKQFFVIADNTQILDSGAIGEYNYISARTDWNASLTLRYRLDDRYYFRVNNLVLTIKAYLGKYQ